MPAQRSVKNGGCWTCRLRRKKCDELHPICGDCNGLEIDCKYGLKPVWMDGGARQKAKAEMLKKDIKLNAAHKREKALISREATSIVDNDQFNVLSDISVPRAVAEPQTGTVTEKPAHIPQEDSLIASLPWSHQEHQRSDTLEHASPSEMNFVMKYLDFVFPSLFPFYQPHIFETGRSWLLLLLRKNMIAYHAILGLSCFYLTMALTDVESVAEHADCKQLRWEEVERETGKCFDSLRAKISALDLSSNRMSVTLLERVELMNGITQVIIFEMAMGRSTSWHTHLPAATILFEEIMNNPGARSVYRDEPQSPFARILLGIGDPLWTNPGLCNHIWSPEQAGFRFCAGFLIFIDVIASTSTGEAPRLSKYHSRILAQVDDELQSLGDTEIRLSKLVGCPNRVVRAIADMSIAISSKETHDLEGQSQVALSDRCHTIAANLADHILTVQGKLYGSPTSYSNCFNPTDLIPIDFRTKRSAPLVLALIWGLAAEQHLYILLNGWDLGNPKIRANNAHIISLLQILPPDLLRTLAWPICIAGCLALESERPSVRALFADLSRTQTAGALNNAREIMEDVWRIKTLPILQRWGLARCLTILGSPVLLV